QASRSPSSAIFAIFLAILLTAAGETASKSACRTAATLFAKGLPRPKRLPLAKRPPGPRPSTNRTDGAGRCPFVEGMLLLFALLIGRPPSGWSEPSQGISVFPGVYPLEKQGEQGEQGESPCSAAVFSLFALPVWLGRPENRESKQIGFAGLSRHFSLFSLSLGT